MKTEYADMKGIGAEIQKAFGADGIHWSCLGHDGAEKLRWAYRYHWSKMLVMAQTGQAAPPRQEPIVVEIGTHRGVSSTILALQGARVITFDIEADPLRERVWNHFGVRDVVTPEHVSGDQEIADRLLSCDFDIAFIDGCHAYASVAANFEAVKKCGRVIFHDYEHEQHSKRTVKFVDELAYGATIKIAPFALWESPDAAGIPWGALQR